MKTDDARISIKEMIPYPKKYFFPSFGLGLVNGKTGAVLNSDLVGIEPTPEDLDKILSEIFESTEK